MNLPNYVHNVLSCPTCLVPECSRALRVLVPQVVRALRALVANVPRVLHALVLHVSRILRALIPYVPHFLRALVFHGLLPCALLRLTCLVSCVFFCPHASCLTCLVSYMPSCFTSSFSLHFLSALYLINYGIISPFALLSSHASRSYFPFISYLKFFLGRG